MKALTLSTIALALTLSSGAAFGLHCPADMKKIDAALAQSPTLDAAQMAIVKELRAAGDELHSSGKHHASVAVLAEAMRMLGVE
ncbi:MAG: hypothetical protein OEQ39_00910 [Gammaproteobacteria bacterium]|nr:hypothetical protein [Gammaproteobacteria bacterium]MDH3465989.1 hypothetical protein [Gammaproteobacteria bacterium]